jgi:hypothetical protein
LKLIKKPNNKKQAKPEKKRAKPKPNPLEITRNPQKTI